MHHTDEDAIVAVRDIAADKISTKSASYKFSAPPLVVFLSSVGEMEEAVIACNTVQICSRSKDVYEAVVFLTGAYYVADFSYPKVYCNMLNEHFSAKCSGWNLYCGAKCIKFMKKYAYIAYKLAPTLLQSL